MCVSEGERGEEVTLWTHSCGAAVIVRGVMVGVIVEKWVAMLGAERWTRKGGYGEVCAAIVRAAILEVSTVMA
jgi:hypothetical protein